MMEINKVYLGDCIEIMKRLPYIIATNVAVLSTAVLLIPMAALWVLGTESPFDKLFRFSVDLLKEE